MFQLLGDSLPVLIYQNFGKLVWPFLFLCIVLGIICAVSLLCFLWSWNSKGFHGSLFGEWLFQKISAKKLSSQIFYVILTSFILSSAACAILIRIARTYFYNFQSSKFFVLFNGTSLDNSRYGLSYPKKHSHNFGTGTVKG